MTRRLKCSREHTGNSVGKSKDNSQYAQARASSAKNQALRSSLIELKRSERHEFLLNQNQILFSISRIKISCKLPRSCKLPLEKKSLAGCRAAALSRPVPLPAREGVRG